MLTTSRRGTRTVTPKGRPLRTTARFKARRRSAMPVRSLSSSVFTWPDAGVVEQAVRQWAHQTARQNAGIRRVGYFGSYARGDWGVGSDVDLIIVVDRAEE